MRKDFPTTSLATVYNALERLKEMEELLELPFSGGTRYDSRSPSPYPRLPCTVCDIVDDLDIDLGTVEEKVAAKRAHADARHRLEFYRVWSRRQGT